MHLWHTYKSSCISLQYVNADLQHLLALSAEEPFATLPGKNEIEGRVDSRSCDPSLGGCFNTEDMPERMSEDALNKQNTRKDLRQRNKKYAGRMSQSSVP